MNAPSTIPGFHHVAICVARFRPDNPVLHKRLGFAVHYGSAVPGRIDRAALLDVLDYSARPHVRFFGQTPCYFVRTI